MTEWYPKLGGETKFSMAKSSLATFWYKPGIFCDSSSFDESLCLRKGLAKAIGFLSSESPPSFLPLGKNYFVRTTCTINNHGLEKCTWKLINNENPNQTLTL